ncbi:MAG: hypothetical protein WCG27_11005 [Pseudomonadota bacterium]
MKKITLILIISFLGPCMGAWGADPFPDLNEVFQGRVFDTKFEKEVFFLKKIHDSYPAHWPSLLSANITVDDYVFASDKLLRFLEKLGTAMAESNDPIAITYIAAIVADPAYYANPYGNRSEIQRAAATALIKIGTKGRQALAEVFTQDRYRSDSSSLEVLAEAIGNSGVADSKLTAALTATAFTFTATNGGTYPRCTKEATKNLLHLPDGAPALVTHLNTKEVLDNPGRFQDVIDGIAAARAAPLTTNLVEVNGFAAAKLDRLADRNSPYGKVLIELQARIQRTIEQLRRTKRGDVDLNQ